MGFAMFAQDGEYECPGCGSSSGDDIWFMDKDEGRGSTKRQLGCDACGCEWSVWL